MPTDFIRYDLLVQDALRSVVRKVLTEAAKTGLQGEHHFNISFKTGAPGVVIPASMRERYPDEMAIILQHEFWELVVSQDQFEVSLSFSRKPEHLIIPFDAITGFSDPSVPFGFKLEPRPVEAQTPAAAPAPTRPVAAKAEPAAFPARSPAAKAKSETAKVPETTKKLDEAGKTADMTKVVSIDAFRKK